ncbi:MerR family transcriptional regulator [Palleronia caenipelagi]|uniref:MerR family transcriptional regulator n=1 Tax=Palleronia caenipelagi TaxID=2489174 RepID=A0A547PXV9_9RHOB|nr:MerR family transcriptional regulator [Palleronia caenipelagi]TRD18878.1 MerR family transcriptional regulator [Palleronia caenipelagi]
MTKSAEAFRTISEVAEWLGTPTHVLRFWETRFSQIKPAKRAGGRRYYRPADMQLIGGIKKLLHEDGLTIKGVQKILREKGVGHVIALAPPLPGQAAQDAEHQAPVHGHDDLPSLPQVSSPVSIPSLDTVVVPPSRIAPLLMIDSASRRTARDRIALIADRAAALVERMDGHL